MLQQRLHRQETEHGAAGTPPGNYSAGDQGGSEFHPPATILLQFSLFPASARPFRAFQCKARPDRGPDMCKGAQMEASSGGRPRMRLLVVDLLATLFVTFCIGTATALVLGACVVLMAGDAHGATKAKASGLPAAEAAHASTADLVLAHYFAAKYAGLIAVDRFTGAETGAQSEPKGPDAHGCPG